MRNVMNWVSVEDQLPGVGYAVLTHYNDFLVFASYEGKKEWRVLMLCRDLSYGFHGNYGPFTPTHWMSLPSPPEVDQSLRPTKPPPPCGRIIRETDRGPYCKECGSSLRLRYMFIRTQNCIQPECKNYA